MTGLRLLSAALLAAFGLAGCGAPASQPAQPDAARPLPDLLLVTLDTTRADAVSPERPGATPNLEALAARGVRFTQAYATAPSTFASHASMMSGLYPAGHGVHENGRRLGDAVPLVAERLRAAGYATAAFVSGYPLGRAFGLDRGFELYDDAFESGAVERRADRTTDAALAWLGRAGDRPRFLWVHYYDPHDPYSPPEPFRSRFAEDPYLGEIAFLDAELGRLLARFEKGSNKGGVRMLVVGDHGEGRGDHGEALHGNLLYQGVMRVPLLTADSGTTAPDVRDDAVSVRQVMPTLLHWAGGADDGSLLVATAQPVLAEAMQPFLDYRWQPQVMATDGRRKLIRAGRLELYDVAADPGERRDLAGTVETPRDLARAVADYPLPSAATVAAAAPLDEEQRRRLASLGYLSSEAPPDSVPAGAPRAADMTAIFADLDRASRAFARGDYAGAAPLLERVVAADPGNLMSAVRLAVARSFLGRDREALSAFAAAAKIDPRSPEPKLYLAQHLRKGGDLAAAAALFEQVLAAAPEREAALSGLAEIRARQGRLADAAGLYERAAPLSARPATIWKEAGLLRMGLGETGAAIAALERSRELDAEAFAADLELGVLYLAARRLPEARDALDRVPADHPRRPMALFKRAQVSVLLEEPDRAERVRAAAAEADATTAPLVAGERLFAGLR